MKYQVNLNDRSYHITDSGEGVCVLLLVHRSAPEQLKELTTSLSRLNYRLLSVDLSAAWPQSPAQLTQSQLGDIASDLHLLADINWLDEIVFAPCLLGPSFFILLEQKLRSRIRQLDSRAKKSQLLPQPA
ncbi:hypothetical protein [Agarivorans aestuarii]|uniref:hypothetical protein n=1 Tax=Agarivorans aestuarii TaxID=1563703 RepID=UPI001C7EA0E9|nr:hypothetical protein [Agarivorans aestuarii]